MPHTRQPGCSKRSVVFRSASGYLALSCFVLATAVVILQLYRSFQSKVKKRGCFQFQNDDGLYCIACWDYFAVLNDLVLNCPSLIFSLSLFLSALTHSIRVPTIHPRQLKIWLGNMLRYCHDNLLMKKHLEIFSTVVLHKYFMCTNQEKYQKKKKRTPPRATIENTETREFVPCNNG